MLNIEKYNPQLIRLIAGAKDITEAKDRIKSDKLLGTLKLTEDEIGILYNLSKYIEKSDSTPSTVAAPSGPKPKTA